MTSPSGEDDLIGRMLAGRYRIGRRIGVGGMGAVYEAFHIDLKRKVAIKVLLDLQSKRAVARFEQEAFANAKVNSAHVVNVIDFIIDETGKEPPFLVMELLEGEPLSRRLHREKTIPLNEAIAITSQVLAGLEAAHQLNIVHRDIKPTNIWLTKLTSNSGEPFLLVKLLDFGVAKLLVDPRAYKTTTGALVGTPSYLAPEQINGTTIDGRTDLHAVAIVLFEMLTGERPWAQKRGPEVVLAILTEKPPSLLEKLPDAPPLLSSLIERALSKNIDERPKSAAAMSTELANIRPSPAGKKRSPSPQDKKSSRTFIIALITTLLLTSTIAIPFAKKRLASQPSPPPSPSTTPITVASSSTVEQQQQQQADDASIPTAPPILATAPPHPMTTKTDAVPALPPGIKPYCHCQRHYLSFDIDLCDQPLPMRCICEDTQARRHATLCAQRYVVGTNSDGEKVWRCPERKYTGPNVKPLGQCVGYRVPVASPDEDGRPNVSHGESATEGTFVDCTDCYNPPLRPGIPNTPCVGFKDGRHEGMWRCFDGKGGFTAPAN